MTPDQAKDNLLEVVASGIVTRTRKYVEIQLDAGTWDALQDWKRQGAALSETAWIPVGESLPSPHSDDDFIIATISGYVTALNFGEQGWYSGFSSNEEDAKDGYWNGCVTHWRPMPEGPALPDRHKGEV